MNDTELENRIKKSAQNMQIKDFSARVANIREIAGNGANAEEVAVPACQLVTQTAGGNAGGRRGVKIAVISAVCAFIVVLAAVLAVVIVPSLSGASTMDAAPAEQAETMNNGAYTDDDNSYNESYKTDDGDVTTDISSAIYADEFYSIFENAGITIADFTIYNDVTYNVCYAADGTPAGGVVVFKEQQTEVKVEFYTAEYSANFDYNAEVNGVCYAVSGDLTDALMQQIIDNLSL